MFVETGFFTYWKPSHAALLRLGSKSSHDLGFASASTSTSTFGVGHQEDDHQTLRVEPNKIVSEAVFWCRWYHTGDLVSACGARYLELPFHEVTVLFELYPALVGLGVEHAEIFVQMLNAGFACDLFDSGTCARKYSGWTKTT